MLNITTDTTTYSVGQTVVTTISFRNTGPACFWSNPDTDPTQCYTASAFNAAGIDVWDSWAGPTVSTELSACDHTPHIVPAGWSGMATIKWSQLMCVGDPPGVTGRPIPNCPETQVPTGTYSIPVNGRIYPNRITITG